MNGSVGMKNDSGPEPDKAAVYDIINNIKSQGVFDQFRKECLADVDTKPAYQNLQSRVENYVNRFLSKQTWTPNLNKNQLRESLRKQINQSGMLTNGVERIIEQVVNPKIFQFIKPRIDEVVCQHLGIDPKQRQEELHQRKLQQQSSQLGATSRDNGSYNQNNPQYTQSNWQPPNPFGAQNPNMPVNMAFPPQFGFNPLHPTFQQIPGWGGLYPPGLEPFSAPPLPAEQPAAPGTEEAPLPPPAAPPPDDNNTPQPPEHEPEEETVVAEEQAEVKADEASKTSGSPMDIDENSRGSSITEVEMTDVEHTKTEVVEPNPPETINTDSQEASKKQYKFAWSKAVEEEEDIDGDLSSIHTSDLSSFEYSSPSENEEDKPATPHPSPVKSPVKQPQQTVQTSEQENTETVAESATTGNETTDVSPNKPRKLLSLTYNLSDSDDDETREERKARIAKEKEERYQKRLQRRAELESKRKERDEERARLKEEKKKKDTEKPAVVDEKTESSQTESKTEEVTSSMETEDEKKPIRKKKTKEERKEQLFQQKAMEKRMALRRQRTRNKRYTSEEFTSIFTSQKTPFSSQNYSQVVEEVETEVIETETIETETIEIDNTMNYTMENFQVSEVSVQTPPTPTQDEYPENVADIPLPDTPGPIELPLSALTSVTIVPSEGQEKIEESQLHAVSPESNVSENSTPVSGSRLRSFSGEGEAPTRRSQRHLAAVETRTRRESQRGKSPEGSRSKTSQRYDTSDLYKPRISRRRQTPPSSRSSETPTASPSLDARSNRRSKRGLKTDSSESVQELEDGSVSVSCTLEVLQGQLEVVDADSGQLKTVSADLMDPSVVTMAETVVVETDVVSSDLLQGDVFEQVVEAGEIETGEVVIDDGEAETETKPQKISRRRHSSKSTRTSSRSTSRSRSHRTSRTSSRSSSRSRSRSRSRHSADRSRRSRSDDSRSLRSRSAGPRSRRSHSESRSYSTSRSYTRSRSYSRSGSYSRSRSHSRSRSYSRSYSKRYSKSRSRSRSRSKSLKSTETISEEEEGEDGELERSKKPIEEVYFGEAERRMREVIRKPVEQISFGLAEQHARHRAPWPAGNWQGQKTRGRANFRVTARGPYTNFQRGGFSERGFRRTGVSPRDDFSSRSPTREAAVSPSKRYYPMGDSPPYNKSPSPTYRPISPGPFDSIEEDRFRDSPARYRPPSPGTPPRPGYRPPSPGARPAYRPPSPSGYHSASPTKTGYRRLERPPSPSSSHYKSPPGSGYKSEPIHPTIRPSTPPPISGDLQTSPISSSPSEGQCTPSPVYDEPVSRPTPPSGRPPSPPSMRPQTPPHIDSPGVVSPPSTPTIRETRRTRVPSPPPVHFTRSQREKSPPLKRPRR